jgi:hypothetical protein
MLSWSALVCALSRTRSQLPASSKTAVTHSTLRPSNVAEPTMADHRINPWSKHTSNGLYITGPERAGRIRIQGRDTYVLNFGLSFGGPSRNMILEALSSTLRLLATASSCGHVGQVVVERRNGFEKQDSIHRDAICSRLLWDSSLVWQPLAFS